MNATEDLYGAGQVHAQAITDRKLRTAAASTLCRAAIQSSAKTIWLLSDTSREVRRASGLEGGQANIEDGLNSLEQYRQRRTREVEYGEYPPKQIAIEAGSIAHKRLCTSEAVFGPWDL